MTTPGFVYDRFAERDRDAGAASHRQAFGADLAEFDHYRNLWGDERLRVLRAGDAFAGMLAFAEAEQYFGGRPVATWCISAVSVPPAFRGRGAALTLMREVLAEARAAGAALSTLFASTLRPYRRAGYELAGTRHRYAAPAALFMPLRRPLHLRLAEQPALAALNLERARRGNGLLARSELYWSLLLEPFKGAVDGYLIDGADGAEGYLLASREAGGYVDLNDWCALTPAALAQVATFLADCRSVAHTARWYGGAQDPLALVAPDRGVRVGAYDHFLLRVLDVPRALVARGWPGGVRTALALEVRDELLPDNGGRFLLEVVDGAASVECSNATAAQITLDARALAPLYSGHVDPASLRAMGWIAGEDDAIAAATTLFAGPAPWLAEFF